MIDIATGSKSGFPTDQYQFLRRELMTSPITKDFVPEFVRNAREPFQFWEFIKHKYSTYAERRSFVWESFRPLIERVEDYAGGSPPDQFVSEALKTFDIEGIHQLWMKALERRLTDPEGAITIARSILESICKHILENSGSSYEPDSDLPGLYKMVSKELNIAPSQHSETVFKQILGGCTAVVEGLGALRNRLSDAHGQGKKPVRPAARHADLAVNLSGSVATFLISTWQAREQRTSPADLARISSKIS